MDSPGLPKQLQQLKILKCDHFRVYQDVMEYFKHVYNINLTAGQNRKSMYADDDFSQPLEHSEQLNILFDLLLSHKLHGRLILYLFNQYQSLILTNIELYHLWCEILVSNKHWRLYHHIKDFLVQHQCMGVYLYFEMKYSSSKKLVKLCQDIHEEIKNELDPSIKSVLAKLIE